MAPPWKKFARLIIGIVAVLAVCMIALWMVYGLAQKKLAAKAARQIEAENMAEAVRAYRALYETDAIQKSNSAHPGARKP